jgi:hypothetical protein
MPLEVDMPEQVPHAVQNVIIRNLCELISNNYPFAETARKMVSLLEEKWNGKAYPDSLSSGGFAKALTNDLLSCSNDRHIHVIFHPETSKKLEGRPPIDDTYPISWWELSPNDNYGIPKLEYLEGNIGYIKINAFAPVILAGNTVMASMRFLSESDAIIFDLRQCRGGDPFCVQLFESHLFPEEKNPKLLLTKYSKVEYPVQQTWSLPFIPGKRLPDVPVFILTSGDTFSGGEDMAYTLMHHKRATIIGETTAGGAHGIDQFSLGSGFFIMLPNSYPEHPETKANWEGTGVTPDIPTTREEALAVAHETALDTLLAQAKAADQSHRIRWHLDRCKAYYHPVQVSPELLARYVGVYRGWEVKLKGNNLYLSEVNGIGVDELLPISETTFATGQGYNLRFEMGEKGKARAITWLPKASPKEIEYLRD